MDNKSNLEKLQAIARELPIEQVRALVAAAEALQEVNAKETTEPIIQDEVEVTDEEARKRRMKIIFRRRIR